MKKIISSICLFALLISCNQESYLIESNNNSQNVTSFEEYIKFFDPETEAHILIQSSNSINASNNIWNINSSIKGDKLPYDLFIDNLMFTTQEVYRSEQFSNWRISNEDLHSLYGKKFRLEKSENVIRGLNTNESSSENDIYIPKLLNAQLSNLQNNSIGVGTTITWNADNLNKRGIIMTMEYKPLDQKDERIATNFTLPIMRGDTMPDSGQYTVTANDLRDFPDGSTISFHIGRAGFTIVNNSESEVEYSVGAYTTIRGDYSIKK